MKRFLWIWVLGFIGFKLPGEGEWVFITSEFPPDFRKHNLPHPGERPGRI
jgi:hypothetical protein